jgi:hypothetical protein
LRRRKFLRHPLTQQAQGAYADFPRGTVATLEPLFEDFQAHFPHSAAHFAQTISGGILCGDMEVAEQGVSQDLESVFLKPRQVEGGSPPVRSVGRLELFLQLFEKLYSRFILFPACRFSSF